MTQRGISVYPETGTAAQWIDYINLAADLGYTRIFSCLLSATGDKEEILAHFRPIFEAGLKRHMEIILDVAPTVFKHLDLSVDDLGFFKALGATGIRLDEGFDGYKEARMTYNPYDLKIELNASIPDGYLANILSHQPKAGRLINCHNFYPQRYTGLSLPWFEKTTSALKANGLSVAAFVSSQEKDAFGPWPLKEGLCTLEDHRDLPLDLQVRHLAAMRQIDAILIANAPASLEELQEVAKLDLDILTFRVKLEKTLTDTEAAILYEYPHIVRPDMSAYMARSTMPRIDYASSSIPADHTRDLKRGDIVILNDAYGRYKAELHLVLKAMPNEGNKNVIGALDDRELFLLDHLEPFRPFKLI